MPRYKLTISYVGTNYHGWQVQENAVAVQPCVQDAMEKVFGFRPDVSGCSRTDSGVHAINYCLHFDYDGSVPPENIVRALNTKLPEDISAKECALVPDSFHARYSVKSKQYIYRFHDGKTRDPFFNGFAYHVKNRLDENIMNEAAKHFVGRFDFAGFCSSGSSVEDTVRTVYFASVERDGDIVTFSVEADGFLYNMVRIMAGTLLYVSMKKIDPDQIENIILSRKRDRAGITAPAFGLYLYKINY